MIPKEEACRMKRSMEGEMLNNMTVLISDTKSMNKCKHIISELW